MALPRKKQIRVSQKKIRYKSNSGYEVLGQFVYYCSTATACLAEPEPSRMLYTSLGAGRVSIAGQRIEAGLRLTFTVTTGNQEPALRSRMVRSANPFSTIGLPGMMMTSESISVVMSVENAQNWLASELSMLVECLADLSTKFEIIVIDNGSRDDTIELIEDMHAHFPQIKFRRLANPLPIAEAMAIGMSLAVGEFVFSASPNARINISDLRRLWSLRIDPRLVFARSRTTARRVDAGLISRLTQWAQRITSTPEPETNLSAESLGGLEMMRRPIVEKLQPLIESASQGSEQDLQRSARLEVSHISHQQLASPKLVEARRSLKSQPAVKASGQ